jgi:hydrogenase expression/formation protein HypC
MCLAIPGKLIAIGDQEPLFRTGEVNFAGNRREVSLACVPDARVGDYVLVHVGLAINTIDPAEARRVFDHLREMGELEESEGRQS